MIIGVPKEVKDNEFRVGLVPAGVKALTDAGHTVYVQVHAGAGSGISDSEYAEAGGILSMTSAPPGAERCLSTLAAPSRRYSLPPPPRRSPA